MSDSVDKRSISRLRCSIGVSRLGQSAAWGELQDISLDGFFLATGQLLPVGAVVPLVLRLSPQNVEVRPVAEVIRHTEEGLGARFVRMGDADRRRLRRFVTELNTISNRRRAAELAAAQGAAPLTVDDRDRIREILAAAAGPQTAPESYILVPQDSDVRVEAHFVAVAEGRLVLRVHSGAPPAVGHPLLVLCTSAFASYAFASAVEDIDERQISLRLPLQLTYSDRRSLAREAPQAGQSVSIPIPWRGNAVQAWPVCDRGRGGLSFRAEPDGLHFWPGTSLPNVTLRGPDGDIPLANVVVKHLTPMAQGGEAPWLKVGISFGVARGGVAITDAGAGVEAGPTSAWGAAVRGARQLADRLSYLYYRLAGPKAGAQAGRAPASVRISFANAAKKPVVALLNRAFADRGKARCPLVIVTPGFAGRKETFSQLATTLVHNFRQQHQDLAVLRLDGTNNLGESYKDPGAEAEGKHTMRFTLSGVVDDIRGAVGWARRNAHIEPSHIVLLSSSFSAISARRAMTLPEMADVGLWIALMGPPDGAHPIANAMGNSDPYKNFLEGTANGMLTMFGCLADGDNVCRDMHEHGLATLESAREDMAKIRADVVWMVGKHDAFIDPVRVEDVMSVKAPGGRRMIRVDSGHLPRSSEQAIAQFRLLSEVVFKHVHHLPLASSSPPPGLLATQAEAEWERVRRPDSAKDGDYWRDYLVGDGGIAYDIWSVTQEYRQLMADQTRLLEVGGQRLLDLGAGTGNAAAAAAAAGAGSIVAMDLVEEALGRARAKVSAHQVPIETHVGSADGSVRTAVRRWLAGDLHDVRELIARLPGRHARALAPLADAYSRDLHGILRGGTGAIRPALVAADLRPELAPLVEDLRLLARWERGILTAAEARAGLGEGWEDADLLRDGLPFADRSFDRVVSSLVISYLNAPEDMLSEIFRVLAPGGRLVLSTLLPDTEGSQNYLNAIRTIESAPAEALPEGHSRQALLDAAHRFLDRACDLVRLEEEGLFRFMTGDELARLAAAAGFVDVATHGSFGEPAQAVILVCRRL